MRAPVCVISLICIALFLPRVVSAQESCMPSPTVALIEFDGFQFSIVSPPGPVVFPPQIIRSVPPDSVMTGEVFIGMSAISNALNGPEAIIPGMGSAPNSQPVDNNSLFDHGDHVLMKYALMIDADPDDLNDPSLYHFINQWYGVRYKWGGTTAKGIDCSALSQKMYGSVYKVNIRRTSKQQYRHSDHFKRFTEAEEGDLVFFRISRLRISHVGIYLANGYFVHASRSKGVMISNLTEKYWKRRYAGCGRIVHEVRGDMESALID